tara:strand:+ start:1169 stop:1435 length:267 start_codon:yes stop_codon:yes gene_type:complete
MVFSQITKINNRRKKYMIPPASNPKWAQLVKGEVSFEYKFLALKIALTRFQHNVKFNNADVNSVVAELRAFFEKNEGMLADDIKTIFG